uniref:Zinc knuckle CX2CX4HX4C domain-containing protein n=1 Tax=Cannabis sativa TaxID=3483 RepID=A0A803QBP8_CANSA
MEEAPKGRLVYDDEDPELSEFDDRWCLVGRFLTKHNIDLQTSKFMSERVIRDVRNYIGTFVKSDPNNFQGVWRNYLRIRVSIRVDLPLQRNMKLEMKSGASCTVGFKYEDLPTFCFICEILGHSKRFCDCLFDTHMHLIEKPYSAELKAPPRRRHHYIGAQWLRSGPTVSSGSSSFQGSHQRLEASGRQAGRVQPHNQQSDINIPDFRGVGVRVSGGYQAQEITGDNGGDLEKLKGVLNNSISNSVSLQLVDSKKRKTTVFEGPRGLIGPSLNEFICIGPHGVDGNVFDNNERNNINMMDTGDLGLSSKGDEVVVDYFNNLFTASSVAYSEVIECVDRVVSDGSNEELSQPVLK